MYQRLIYLLVTSNGLSEKHLQNRSTMYNHSMTIFNKLKHDFDQLGKQI